MSTWGFGPFDNDAAADWAGDFDEANADARPDMIRDVLRGVVDDAIPDLEAIQVAIAAAAVVAVRFSGLSVESGYAPDALEQSDLGLVDADRVLADRALGRIATNESEWRDLWEMDGTAPEAVAELARIRAALTSRQ